MSLKSSEWKWVSKNGRETPIENMQTRHLVNTIKLIERGEHGTIDKEHPMYDALKTELKGRGKKNKIEKILGTASKVLTKTGFMSKKAKISS